MSLNLKSLKYQIESKKYSIFFQIKIVSAVSQAIDEGLEEKSTHFVLVNQADRSLDVTQITKVAMVDYEKKEREFFKNVVEYIIDHSDREIDSISATNLANSVKMVNRMKTSDADKTLRKLEADKWLTVVGNHEYYRLSPRFLAEMEPYLKAHHADEIGTCPICNKTVVWVSVLFVSCNFILMKIYIFRGKFVTFVKELLSDITYTAWHLLVATDPRNVSNAKRKSKLPPLAKLKTENGESYWTSKNKTENPCDTLI